MSTVISETMAQEAKEAIDRLQKHCAEGWASSLAERTERCQGQATARQALGLSATATAEECAASVLHLRTMQWALNRVDSLLTDFGLGGSPSPAGEEATVKEKIRRLGAMRDDARAESAERLRTIERLRKALEECEREVGMFLSGLLSINGGYVCSPVDRAGLSNLTQGIRAALAPQPTPTPAESAPAGKPEDIALVGCAHCGRQVNGRHGTCSECGKPIWGGFPYGDAAMPAHPCPSLGLQQSAQPESPQPDAHLLLPEVWTPDPPEWAYALTGGVVETVRAKARADKLYADGMVAHYWFAEHFGESMNGRDFSVKCPMATDLLLEKLDSLDAAREAAEETVKHLRLEVRGLTSECEERGRMMSEEKDRTCASESKADRVIQQSAANLARAEKAEHHQRQAENLLAEKQKTLADIIVQADKHWLRANTAEKEAERLRGELEAFGGDEDYVAWLCYRRSGESTTIHVCNSDTPTAFRVWRRRLTAKEPKA